MRRHISLLQITSLVILSAGLLLSSCKQEKKEEKKEQTQMELVMSIHDEVMPKMGKLGQLRTQVQQQIDTTSTRGLEAREIGLELQDAYDSMMSWMAAFGGRFDSEEIMNGAPLSQEKQQWLDEEEEKVKVVRDKINNSIARAETFLQS